MSKIIKADFKGMSTTAGQLARPAGGTIVQQNMNIEAPGIMRLKRGNTPLDGAGVFSAPIWSIFSASWMGTNIFANLGSVTSASLLAFGDGTSAPTIFGTLNNDKDHRMKGATGKGLLTYLTSFDGLKRFGSASSFEFAGMPRGLAPDKTRLGANVLLGVLGFLPDLAAVAYRVTWHQKLGPNSEVLLSGAPTGRVVVANRPGTTGYVAATARNTLTAVPIPWKYGTQSTAVTTNYFFRVWRTRNFASGDPDDEMQLCYESGITAADITNGYVTFFDILPEALLGAYLNTDPNSGLLESNVAGIANADDPPPNCTDVAVWADCLWAGNLQISAQASVQLLSVVAGVGLTVGDIISVNGVNFTAVAGAPVGDQFNIETTLTTSQNIEKTSTNFCEAVNRSVSSTGVYAFYVSGSTSAPGQMLFIAKDLTSTGSIVITQTTHGSAFRPNLTSGPNFLATNPTNALAYSKSSRPDAFSLTSVFFVGAADNVIDRVMPLGETLFVFTSQGLYRITGNYYGNFSLTEFDLTFRLIGREYLVALDNALYAWGRDGIARITQAGVEHISLPIKENIELVTKTTTSNSSGGFNITNTWGFAVADTFMHRVYFWYPGSQSHEAETVLGCTRAFVWDVRTETWSTSLTTPSRDGNGFENDTRSCGLSRVFDDYLLHGSMDANGGDSALWVERRAYNDTDYNESSSLATNRRVQGDIQFVFDNPNPGSNVHFQEVVVYWELNDIFAYRDPPTAPQIFVNNDLVGSAPNLTVAPQGESVSRYIVPQNNRRAKRLNVRIVPTATAQYAGIEAVVVRLEDEDAKGMVR